MIDSLLIFFFAELIRPFIKIRGNNAIRPQPIELAIYHYESFRNRGAILRFLSGLWKVGVDNNDEYVIGFLEASPNGYILCPFVAPRVDIDNRIGRVKLRIHEANANEILPIFGDDPLNNMFFKPLQKEHIRDAHF